MHKTNKQCRLIFSVSRHTSPCAFLRIFSPHVRERREGGAKYAINAAVGILLMHLHCTKWPAKRNHNTSPNPINHSTAHFSKKRRKPNSYFLSSILPSSSFYLLFPPLGLAIWTMCTSKATSVSNRKGRKMTTDFHTKDSTETEKKKKMKCRLISYMDLPEYMKDNEYILQYYRAEWPLKEAFLSLFRWHNETLNIWT